MTVIRKIFSAVPLFLSSVLWGQNPTHYPTPGTEPVEFTTWKIIFYIVIPALLIAAFIVFRAAARRKGENSGE